MKITPRVILITIDGVAALLALAIGAMVLIFRESKVILFVEIASVVLASLPRSYYLNQQRLLSYFLEKKKRIKNREIQI